MIRLPISNSITGEQYAAILNVGANAKPVRFLLDTGSSAFAIGGNVYDPASDPNAKTTNFLQVIYYQSGSFTGGVVKTSVSATDAATGQAVDLSGVNLAVAYDQRPDNFSNADGILGLAYQVLDNAYSMPADTWKNQYYASQIGLGQPCDIDPFFDQLSQTGLIAKKFAFRTNRSLTSARQADPSADPLNAGTFVLGGGEECADLYEGAFVTIAVMHEQYYNVNLTSVQVGDHPAIAVRGVAPGSTAASNAMIDSGSPILMFDRDLFSQVLAAFGAIDAAFPNALGKYASGAAGCDQTTLDLTRWPPLTLGFQDSTGSTGILTVAPQDYWQFDAAGQGLAVAVIGGDGGMLGGMSSLGLPIFSGRYVVFDRTASSGHGVIRFASQA